MDISLRLVVVALPCACLAACGALLPAMFLPPLALKAGVLGVSAAACASDNSCERQAPPRCADTNSKAIAITEQKDMAVPPEEGNVAVFQPAYWQSEFVADVAAKGARPGEDQAGAFVLTEKSLLFVPPPGAEGVRIPIEAVVDVQTQTSAATGAARQVTVESCFGRLDRFVFGQKRDPRRLDSEATTAAAADLKARVAASNPAAQKESKAAR
jgi:hypothetical protein